jgi:hypothetical protein
MRCLTVTQPWATLVAIGAKNIETRSWWTIHRGPLAIHAAQAIPPAVRKRIEDYWSTDAAAQEIRRTLYVAGYTSLDNLPLGQVLCTCHMVGCEPIAADNRPPWPELAFGDYTLGRYMWHFDAVRRLDKPAPAKGAQGLWEWESASLAHRVAVLDRRKGELT